MLSIGDFARYCGVSVRMLRHYDERGLLVPAQVDPVTGYRSYTAAQFPRINRLVALKDLGFTLDQVGQILDGGLEPDELRGMLRLRQAELTARLDADGTRLESVAARLRAIESEGLMSELEYVEKSLSPVRLAQLTTTVTEAAEIGPAVGALFGRLGAEMGAAGLPMDGAAQTSYDPSESGVRITAGWPTTLESPGGDLEVADLPGVERALTVVHRGSVADIGTVWQSLEGEVERRGITWTGPGREVYHEVDADAPDSWVIELQLPVA